MCGAACTEELFEFRCYVWAPVGPDGQSLRGLDGIKYNRARKLSPCRAFISKECGRNLLGVQSALSKFLENIADIVTGEDPVERLRELWVNATERHRRIIQDKLRFLAHQEEGGSSERDKAQVIKKDGDFFKLDQAPKAQDPFRAVSQSVTTLTCWDLLHVHPYLDPQR